MTPTPRRVLVVAPSVRGADGVSVVGRQIVEVLRSASSEVETWVLDDPDRRDLVDAAASAPEYMAQGSRVGIVWRGWRATVARDTFDLVVVTHLHLLPVVAGLMLRGIAVAVYLHGIEAWQMVKGQRRALLQRADRLLANSRYTAERFARSNPDFQKRRIHICAPAVPADIVASQVPDEQTVLVVGRIHPEERYKGHDLLLDIWPAIRARFPAAHLVFAGDGDDRARLEHRIHSEGLSHAVSVTGLLSRAELRAQYARCRVFAMPSGSEGFGIVFLEAMATGRPCIAAHGAADEILDGDTGMLIGAGDGEALTASLIRLLGDVDLCRAMGAAAAQRVHHRYGMPRLQTELLAALA